MFYVIQFGVRADITWGAHLHRPYWTLMIECMPNKLEWEFKWGSGCLWGKLKQTPGQLAEKSLWLMVSVWDRSAAVGGCFGLLRRTDFVCLSIAYSVTVWFGKCLLCFHWLRSVTPIKTDHNNAVVLPVVLETMLGCECINTFENDWNIWNMLVHSFILLLYFTSSTVTWSWGEWSDLISSLTTRCVRIWDRKWWCSCDNWSKAQRAGSACFCYNLFYMSQNRILKPSRHPLILTSRCMINTHIKGCVEIAGFFEACLWSWICWANMVHRTPLNKLV